MNKKKKRSLSKVLCDDHLTMLRDESGISDDVIKARGYKTINDRKTLEELGFPKYQCRVPGLLLPLHTTDGKNSVHVYRPDNPRVTEQKRKGKLSDGTYPNKVIKYEFPKGAGTRVDCPPTCQPMLKDPRIPLWITEGQKKADALASHELCVIALLGVWNWKGKNELGGTTFLNDFDYIALDKRDVRIVFDSDIMTKPEVRGALVRFTEHLQRKGAHVSHVHLPGGTNGKVGVDDWLADGHTVEELEMLIEGPRPDPKPATPIVELLDDVPPAMRRPLALIDGRGYAGAWLPVRITRTEKKNNKGEIVKLDHPLVETCMRLFVVLDDGKVFGEGGDGSMENLGLEVHLPEPPPTNKLWSSPAVKEFRKGVRPNPLDVFDRVVAVVDRFIDFDRSLADQQTMAEMIACYILGTYFLDAFNVVGFLWPNGGRGSGKTHLLMVVAELAYLGQVILSGGSYASLRDMADYGATLAFDDAENLSDPKQTDPDKRTLLLAGNRRGNTVPVKELGADKKWRTRYVNTFCPRLFSAIELPDEVLGSRSIVVPLIRTPDRARANADPLEFEAWPHDRGKLIDDLWALGLAHLAEMQKYDRYVGEHARLAGRNLQPWRAILAVAAWLDTNGRSGMWEKMEELACNYHYNEKPNLETGDLTRLIIRALCHCAISANSANNGETLEKWVFETKEITQTSGRLASAEDAGSGDINSHRVGRILGQMRLEPSPRPGGKGSRRWEVARADLDRLVKTYGLTLPPALQYNGSNGSNGSNGTSEKVTDPQEDIPEEVASSQIECPTEPCWNCGATSWWQHPHDGGWICGQCHPNPSVLRSVSTT